MNSPSTEMNEDTILEILSYCPATEIAKFRQLNKACNKRSYEFYFTTCHLPRTNSVFGYLIQCSNREFKYRSSFVSGVEEETPEKTIISLDFLPSKHVKIEACDTRNGILLCVDEDKYEGGRRIPDYIVCKPATKEYRIIPNPKTRYFTVVTGLMVIQSDPFRYKIVRVSEPMKHERRKMKEGCYNLNCEVFDSDSFAWKRLNDLELPRYEFIRRSDKPVSSYGFLHWLTTENNVIRFCMRTETWSFFPVPVGLVSDGSPPLALVRYEGKLGLLVSSRGGEDDDLWVLENSFGKSWINVKDGKITRSQGSRYVEPIWFVSNDVVSMAGFDRLSLYNMNSNKSKHLHMNKTQDFFLSYYHSPKDCFIPFYSNYDTVGLSKDSTVVNNQAKGKRVKPNMLKNRKKSGKLFSSKSLSFRKIQFYI
ncbi:unnamed protein product [Arabis nemorensis]|uniref:F-box associated beta-propeller type 3 domain-containing protein n=1 Tax=Arabis nemorensis TaxID=586526 RepID=A0A565C7C9_9BRAS|nr:unnamed protein product [Arabis nemorensis]